MKEGNGMAAPVYGVFIAKNDDPNTETRTCAYPTKKRAEEEVAWYKRLPDSDKYHYEVRRVYPR
jgi:hypothetical protein